MDKDDCTPNEVTEKMIDAGIDCLFDMKSTIEGPSIQELRDAIKRAYLRMSEVQKEVHAEQ